MLKLFVDINNDNVVMVTELAAATNLTELIDKSEW